MLPVLRPGVRDFHETLAAELVARFDRVATRFADKTGRCGCRCRCGGAAYCGGGGGGAWYTGAVPGTPVRAVPGIPVQEPGRTGRVPGTSPVFAPQIPQNFSSGASGAPQERQVSPPDGGAGGAAAAGDSSMSDAPQERQNFCEEPTLLPHSGQNGIG